MISFDIDNVRFNYSVGGILINNDKILLNRLLNETYWFIPGGRVEGGEDSAKALSREMMEELNENVIIENMLFMVENFFINKGTKFHEIGIYYSMSGPKIWNDSKIIKDGGVEIEYRWIDVEKLKTIELYPVIIKDAIIENKCKSHYIVREY
jgi:ADP-ribose pyrophosphatase YjhB (NUDIX family)